MIHIIDANNLAGKLDLLGEERFDEKLIGMIKEYYRGKKIFVYLVFDSADLMGDRIEMGYLTVIYAPRDNFYSSADDKIIELVEQSEEKQIKVITDDLGIIDAAADEGEKIGKEVQIIKASDLAEKMKAGRARQEKNGKDSPGEEEIKKLNDELFNLWK